MLEPTLNAMELRILGSLIEKESTTPEYYPLTLNSLLSACNQKTNRWPVTNFTEADIAEALRSLRAARYATEITGAGMRVAKYAQRFTETLNLGRRETAILCVLMLRGPQTMGEIKDRTERLHPFGDLEEVEGVLQKLADLGMTVQLERLPGQKEHRYAQLLGGPPEQEISEHANSPAPFHSSGSPGTTPSNDRLTALEEEVSRLRQEVVELRRRLEAVL